MGLFKKNRLFFFIYLSVVVITSEAREKKPMCKKYAKQVCNLSPRQFGQSQRSFHIDNSLNHIVGGEKSLPRQYPHMALIGYHSRQSKRIFWHCGGSLISRHFVLTASHCVAKIPTRVRLGDLDFATGADDAKPHDFKIKEIIKHPKYDPNTFSNDIALVRFRGLSAFSDSIRPICLNAFESIPYRNQKLIAVGWGNTEHEDGDNTVLRNVELNLESNQKCSSQYNHFNPTIMLCVGYTPGGKGTCQGDSGGPLLFLDKETGCSRVPIYTQVGIVSSGRGCAEPDLPHKLTKVSRYISWIEKIVWNTSS